MPQGDRPAEDGQQATHLRHAAWSAHQHISDTLPGLHTNTSQTHCLVCTQTHLRHAAWSAHQHISDTLPGLHTNTSQTRCLVCTQTHPQWLPHKDGQYSTTQGHEDQSRSRDILHHFSLCLLQRTQQHSHHQATGHTLAGEG